MRAGGVARVVSTFEFNDQDEAATTEEGGETIS